MVKIFRKSEIRGDEFCSSKLNAQHQIHRFTLILYGVGVRCDRGRFSLHGPLIQMSTVNYIYCLFVNILLFDKHQRKVVILYISIKQKCGN